MAHGNSTNKLRVGLIGAGNISDTHARAAAAIPGVEVAAVFAPTRAHAEQLAGRYGGTACESLDALLAHVPLDMVVIGSPSGLHAEQGIAAAKRGLRRDCLSVGGTSTRSASVPTSAACSRKKRPGETPRWLC